MKRLPFALPLALLALCACKTATTEKAAAPSQSASAGSAKAGVVLDPSTPVATVDGQAITYGDLEKEQKDLAGKVKQKEAAFQQEVYEMRSGALDNLLFKRLFGEEAKKANKSVEDWVKTDFQATVPKPTDAEIDSFFAQHKEELPPGTKLDDVKERIVQFIHGQKTQEALRKKFDGLKATHQVKVSMVAPEPSRTEVAATGPAKGPQAAKVTIVEFSDFECPFCGKEIPVVDRVMKEYDGKVRLVFRQFPLNFHPHAGKAAEASLCAADQGVDKFWVLHDKMFTNQKALEVDSLKQFAKAAGIDSVKFDKCLESGEKKALVDADQKAGEEAGVNGTPAFFVNGILISGAQEFDKFKDVIDRELQK